MYVLKEDRLQALASRLVQDTSVLTSSAIQGIASIGQQLHNVEHRVNDALVAAIQEVHEEMRGLRADVSQRLQSMEDTVRSIASAESEQLAKIWQDKLSNLEAAILAKNERRIGIFLTSLRSETSAITHDTKLSDELSFIKEELALVLKGQGANEEAYRKQSGLLLQGLKNIQTQLDSQAATLERIEKGVDKIFVAVDRGMTGIRESLQSNQDDLEDLKLLHTSWKNEVQKIEDSMMNKPKDQVGVINSAFNDLKDYFESYASSLEGSLRESMGREFAAMREKLLKGDGDRVLSELRAVQTQLTEVLCLGQETRAELAKGLKILQTTVVNVNERTCPTLFIMSLPEEEKEKGPPVSVAAAAIDKAQKLYAFAFDSTARQDMILEQLRDKLYLSLVCELCHQPQLDLYTVTKPREFVAKVLPLAKVGLKVVCGLNSISKLGRVFGLPSPVIADEDLVKAKEFADSVGKSSLDDYKQLQERAQLGSEKSMGEGYCAREFRRFLKNEDPKDYWSGLAPKVTPDGFVFFACGECCAKKCRP